MSDEKNIGAELLKQNGLSQSDQIEREREQIHKLLERDRTRARILKWVMLGCLAVPVSLLALILGGFVLAKTLSVLGMTESAREWLVPFINVGFFLTLLSSPLAVVGGILGMVLLFYARSVDSRAIQVKLAELELLLRNPPPD